MACTTETPGTLANATQSAVPSSPCAGNPNDDVWFKFTATGPTHYVFLNDVVGNVTDLVLGVYSGSCGSLTNIRCIHALDFSVTDLNPGHPYWVGVFSVDRIMVEVPIQPMGDGRSFIVDTRRFAQGTSFLSSIDASGSRTNLGCFQKF